MKVGRETRVYLGDTQEELQLKVRLALKEFREMGFLPQLSTPAMSFIAGDSVPGFYAQASPRAESNHLSQEGELLII